MHTSMQQARDWGLKLLQPERQVLEHGLDLHRQSVVCDAFCLGFGAAVDGAACNAAIEAGATLPEISRLMSRTQTTRWADDQRQTDTLREALGASGLTLYLQNVESGETSLEQINRLAAFTHLVDRLPDVLKKIVMDGDVARVKAAGGHGIAWSLNHVPLVGEWRYLRDEVSLLQPFHDLGVRMMHLTYNRRNRIGDGCYEPANAGLSDFGRRVIGEMNRVGLLVDVAHCGRQTSLEAAQASKMPVVASHTVCCAVHEHPRGKPDAVIRSIADSGGYVGMTCVPPFLGGYGDIRSLLDHIVYAARKFGADHVAIGTDLPWGSELGKEEAAKFPRPSKLFRSGTVFEGGIGSGLDETETEDQLRSMVLTNWPLFTVGLVQRGLPDADIQKIIGGNVVRVLQAVEQGAAT